MCNVSWERLCSYITDIYCPCFFTSQDNNGQHANAASFPKIAVDTVSRITYLESELAEALEANNMYRAQLKRSVHEIFSYTSQSIYLLIAVHT